MDHGDIIAKILDDKDKNYLTVFFSLNGERKKALNNTLDYFKTKCVDLNRLYWGEKVKETQVFSMGELSHGEGKGLILLGNYELNGDSIEGFIDSILKEYRILAFSAGEDHARDLEKLLDSFVSCKMKDKLKQLRVMKKAIRIVDNISLGEYPVLFSLAYNAS